MIAYWSEIERAAMQYGLDPKLVAGVVAVESSGNQFAYNPEEKYQYFWDVNRDRPFRSVTPAELVSMYPPRDFGALKGDADQEWWAQRASWGLMQLMGAVARELGFKKPFLTELTDVRTNLSLGCLKLSQLMTWAKRDVVRAVAAYNGGTVGNFVQPYRNQAYADRVLSAAGKVVVEV